MKILIAVFFVAAYDLAGGQNNQDYGPDDYAIPQNSYNDYTNEGTELEYTCYRLETFHNTKSVRDTHIVVYRDKKKCTLSPLRISTPTLI